jgi:hypothetical protein
MIDPTKFRRELSDLADVLGDACEGLAAAIHKDIPVGGDDLGARDLLRMVDELKRLAKMLASLNEGSGSVH